MKKPYGFEFFGKVMRKWEAGGQTLMGVNRPEPVCNLTGQRLEWHQVALFAWDYSGHKVVEFEPVEKEIVNEP